MALVPYTDSSNLEVIDDGTVIAISEAISAAARGRPTLVTVTYWDEHTSDWITISGSIRNGSQGLVWRNLDANSRPTGPGFHWPVNGVSYAAIVPADPAMAMTIGTILETAGYAVLDASQHLQQSSQTMAQVTSDVVAATTGLHLLGSNVQASMAQTGQQVEQATSSLVTQTHQVQAATAGLQSLTTNAQAHLTQQQHQVQAVTAGLQSLSTNVQAHLTQQQQQVQAATAGLHSLGSTVETATHQVRQLLQQAQHERAQIDQARAAQNAEAAAIELQRQQLATIAEENAAFAATLQVQHQQLMAAAASDDERRRAQEQYDSRLQRDTAAIAAAQQALDAQRTRLTSEANSLGEREAAFRRTSLELITLQAQQSQTQAQLLTPPPTQSAQPTQMVQYSNTIRLPANIATQARPAAQIIGVQATPFQHTVASQARVPVKNATTAVGSSLQGAYTSRPVPHPSQQLPLPVPTANTPIEVRPNINDDQSLRLRTLEQQYARLLELQHQQPHAPSVTDDSDDAVCATDDEDETSCATAIRDWSLRQRVLSVDERFAEEFCIVTLSRDKIESDWRKYLRVPSVGAGMNDIIDETIGSILEHSDAAKLATADNSSARVRYAMFRLLRRALISGHRLCLTLHRVTQSCYAAFAQALRDARAKKRKKKAAYETLTTLTSRLLQTAKYQQPPPKEYGPAKDESRGGSATSRGALAKSRYYRPRK